MYGPGPQIAELVYQHETPDGWQDCPGKQAEQPAQEADVVERTDSDNLRLLAAWFDAEIPDDPNPEIQTDLRRIADEIEALRAERGDLLSYTDALENQLAEARAETARWKRSSLLLKGAAAVVAKHPSLDADMREALRADIRQSEDMLKQQEQDDG